MEPAAEIGLGLASGDYDGDGALDIITGDFYADSPDLSWPPGAAYAFLGPFSGTTSVDDAVATWAGVEEFGYVGWAVAAADADGDDSLDVFVGASGVDSFKGAVYLQLGFASGVVEIDSLPHFSVADADALGKQVAALPDWDGDGGVEIAMGAPWTNALAGAVFVFESDTLFP